MLHGANSEFAMHTLKIRSFHQANRCIYGSPRIHRDLLAIDEMVGVNRVARLMSRAGIQSKMARKFVCESAFSFDPADFEKFKKLVCRSAPKPRADLQ